MHLFTTISETIFEGLTLGNGYLITPETMHETLKIGYKSKTGKAPE